MKLLLLLLHSMNNQLPNRFISQCLPHSLGDTVQYN